MSVCCVVVCHLFSKQKDRNKGMTPSSPTPRIDQRRTAESPRKVSLFSTTVALVCLRSGQKRNERIRE